MKWGSGLRRWFVATLSTVALLHFVPAEAQLPPLPIGIPTPPDCLLNPTPGPFPGWPLNCEPEVRAWVATIPEHLQDEWDAWEAANLPEIELPDVGLPSTRPFGMRTPDESAAPAEGNQASPQKGMFYYPWYPENWGSGANFPQSHYSFPGTTPVGGYYSTTAAIPRHVDDMVYAGMDFGITSWYRCGTTGGDVCGPDAGGPGSVPRSVRDIRHEQLLNEMEGDGRGLAGSIYYEFEGFADPGLNQIRSDLRYLTQKYISDPVLNRRWLKYCVDANTCYPVIFVYAGGTGPEVLPCGNSQAGITGMVERWEEANRKTSRRTSISYEPRVSFHIALKVFGDPDGAGPEPDWRGCQTALNLNPNLFSWHQYGPANAVQQHLPYSHVISPGFRHWQDTGTPGDTHPHLARLSDSAWRTNITNMVNSGAKWQLVTTYNEWQEGTGVEPASGSVTGTTFSPTTLYLDALHDILVGGPADEFVVYAAGDVASNPQATCPDPGPNFDTCRQQQTSDIILGDPSEDLVLVLGDTQYETGDFNDFMFPGRYHDTWGRVLDITRPSVGNHEYCSDVSDTCGSGDDGAEGYEQYFGPARAGPVDLNYYSFDQGGWHFIALNSQCSAGTDPDSNVGCNEGTTQNTWLENDLAATTEDCSIAYMHHPRFSVGDHGDDIDDPNTNDQNLHDLFNDLYVGGVDIVLVGHDHSYQRFNLMNGSGAADSAGLRYFVVGTGGKNLTCVNCSTTAATAGVVTVNGNNSPDGLGFNNGTFGVLKLTLGNGSYSWEFRPDTATGTYMDNGGPVACSNT